MRGDILEPLQAARALGLLVNCGVQRVAFERKTDGDDVGVAVAVDCRQPSEG